MDKINEAAAIREEILALTARYYACVHDKSSEAFIPGESRVNYAGRCFDEKEMVNLVDSSLEFWLTSGISVFTDSVVFGLSVSSGVKFIVSII